MKIDVDKFIKYCEECADMLRNMSERVLDKIGDGESESSALGACAYFMQRENMFRYEIPGIIKDFVENEKTI